ncbi:MAG: antitoxin Xre/MbcA/ParS toxin-binding domain-containing protein [Candidatus Solibacter sp.]
MSTHFQEPAWSSIVDRIRGDDPAGMEELYARFEKDVRSCVWRQLGPLQVDDRVYDILQDITDRIRKGEILEPGRFMPCVRTLIRRQAADWRARSPLDVDPVEDLMDQRPEPERLAIKKKRFNQALEILSGLSQRDREVLRRFYLQEEPAEEICRALQLTETQFRLIKSRAKARFAELWRRRYDSMGLPEPGTSASPSARRHTKSGAMGGQVLRHAAETFGSAEKADHWLNRPNHVFQGRTPLEMLAIDPKSVEIELSRIDYGVYI